MFSIKKVQNQCLLFSFLFSEITLFNLLHTVESFVVSHFSAVLQRHLMPWTVSTHTQYTIKGRRLLMAMNINLMILFSFKCLVNQ